MRGFVVLCLALCSLLGFLFLAPDASARTVRWSKIEVRKGDDGPRVEKTLGKHLKRATRAAEWGKGDPIDLSARLTLLSWEERDDVLRVTVTVVAKIVGRQGARSHIRIGGHPKDRRNIESEALRIVSEGLITRLSDMARNDK